MEEVAVYGFMTPLKLKIIVALALTDTVVRDQDMLIVRPLLLSNRSLTVWLSCIHIGCYRCSKPSTPPTPSRSQTRFSGYTPHQRVAVLRIPALHCLPRRMRTRANRRHSRSEWMRSRERSSGTNERSFTHVSSCDTLNKVGFYFSIGTVMVNILYGPSIRRVLWPPLWRTSPTRGHYNWTESRPIPFF